MTVFQLSVPITHGQESLTELTINEPTAKQIREIGIPFRISALAGGQDFEINAERMCRYISKLALIPPSVVDQICAFDFVRISEVIGSFFEKSPGLTNKAS